MRTAVHTHGIKMAEPTRAPLVLWAQRSDRLLVTIELEDIRDHTLDLTDDHLNFSCKGGKDQLMYELKMEFYKSIKVKESKQNLTARNLTLALKKAEEGPFWPRMLADAKKPHWLKTDFNKWKDEDDSDVDGQDEMQLEDMMKQMGSFNSPDNKFDAGEVSDDSDDEDLPDLE